MRYPVRRGAYTPRWGSVGAILPSRRTSWPTRVNPVISRGMAEPMPRMPRSPTAAGPAPSRHGCDVPDHPVDEPVGEEGRGESWPALEQHVLHVVISQGRQDTCGRLVREDAQWGPPIAQRRVRGDLRAPHDDPERLPTGRVALRVADRQRGVVGQGGARADQDRIDPCAKPVDLGAGGLPGDPPAGSVRGCDPTVKRARDLPGDHRAAVRDCKGPRLVDVLRLVGEQPRDDLDARRREALRSPGRQRVGISLGVDDAGNAGIDQCLGARTCPPGVVARLERDHGGRATGGSPGGLQCCGLGVGRTSAAVETLRDSGSGRIEQDTSHPRVRAARDAGRGRQLDGTQHRRPLGCGRLAVLAHRGDAADAAARRAVQAAAGSAAPKTAEPATSTSAPASAHRSIVDSDTPPST